jgi:hypothetical protein
MIINNFNFVCISIYPPETDAPLPIDANAVLPSTIAIQRFQPVAGDRRQIFKPQCRV